MRKPNEHPGRRAICGLLIGSMITLLMLAERPAHAQAGGQSRWNLLDEKTRQTLTAHYEKLNRELENPEFAGSLTPLAVSPDELRRRLGFDKHSRHASLLYKSEAPLQRKRIPRERLIQIKDALAASHDFVPAGSPLVKMVNGLPQSIGWGLTLALHDQGDYGAAARFGHALIARETPGETRDMLCLLTARCLWLSTPGKPDESYQPLLEAACNSAVASVAENARLWREATTSPASFDAIQLSQQIWDTLFYDLQYREKAARISFIIGSRGRLVCERIRKAELPDEGKEILIGRVAVFVSEAGFNQQRGNWQAWAVEEFGRLRSPDPDARATARYYKAMSQYAAGDYARSAAEFQEILFEEAPSDATAEAGYMMAVSYVGGHDGVSAQAALRVIKEFCPDQKQVIDKSEKLLREISAGNDEKTNRLVGEYIEKRFGPRLAEIRERNRRQQENKTHA